MTKNLTEKTKFTQRLHFKLALFVSLTIVVIFGLFAAYQLVTYRQKLTAREIASSEELCRTLTSSLEIGMLHSDLPAIQRSFEQIAVEANIRRVFLVNREGRVAASSERELAGQTINTDAPGCRECHELDPTDRHSAIVIDDGEKLLRVVTPIENKPQCHTCHDAAIRINGVMVLDRQLWPVEAEIGANLRLAGLVAGGAILAMMFLFRWYIKRLVINRVVYLESLARRVVANELDLDLHLSGRDELASLAHSFNNMKKSLKLSIERLEGHQHYLTNLLDNLVDGILIGDDHHRIALVNRSFHRIVGLETAQVQPGDELNFLQPPLDRLSPLAKMIYQVETETESAKEMLTISLGKNQLKYLEVHLDRLSLPPRRKTETLIVLRDITTRVLIERQVNQAEKLATVGRLAAGVAHEINNPLASILTCAEGLLKRNHFDAESIHEYLEIIRQSTQRCKLITQKLLDYSAKTTLSMAPLRLDSVLQEAVSLLQFEATTHQIKLTLKLPQSIRPIAGRKDSLVQVFVNLILNAVQAIGSGGSVTVEVQPQTAGVEIFVVDDGPGISELDLPHVFDPFFTTKPVGEGTGLGLSVSQGIIKQHGGEIVIETNRPGGTSVRVFLPWLTEKEGKNNG